MIITRPLTGHSMASKWPSHGHCGATTRSPDAHGMVTAQPSSPHRRGHSRRCCRIATQPLQPLTAIPASSSSFPSLAPRGLSEGSRRACGSPRSCCPRSQGDLSPGASCRCHGPTGTGASEGNLPRTAASPHAGSAWVALAGTRKCQHHWCFGTRALGGAFGHVVPSTDPAGRGAADPQHQRGSPRVFPELWAARTGLLQDLAAHWESRDLPTGVTTLSAEPPVSHTQAQTSNTSQNPPVNAQLVRCHEPSGDQTRPHRPASPLPRACHRDLPGTVTTSPAPGWFGVQVKDTIKHPLPWHLLPQEPRSCSRTVRMGRWHCHPTGQQGGQSHRVPPAASGWQGLLRSYSTHAACNFGLLKS